jgi:hypothetical protein
MGSLFQNLCRGSTDRNWRCHNCNVGHHEIGIGGVETKGLLRGPAYQIFESNGILLLRRFALNPNFSALSSLAEPLP